MAEPLRTLAVTGASGFLGRRLVALAAPHFDEVRAVDIAPWPDDEGPGNVRAFTADITRPGALDEALRGADTVFHAAAVVDVRPRRNPVMEAVNVDGTRHVVDACRRLGVARLLHTSTMDVAFDGTPRRGGDESIPYPARPANRYIGSKIDAERIALAANDPPRLAVASLRPTGIYGPHDRHRIGALTASVRRGELSVRFGDGSAHFDHVYVDNVAHAHVLAARALADGATTVAGRAYFIGDHPTGNFFEFLAPLFAAAGAVLPERHLPTSVALLVAAVTEWLYALLGPVAPSFNPQLSRYVVRTLAQDWTFSYARATRDFGYRPIVSLEEATARTAAWARGAGL